MLGNFQYFPDSPYIKGFTIKEEATYDDVRFNWVAETTYSLSDTEPRFVEFGVSGENVANARLKWWKDTPDANYGKYTITIYVNEKPVYSVNQTDGKSLSGVFATPLPDLQTGDKVKFEIHKIYSSYYWGWQGMTTIAACLEYTSNNGGKREMIHHKAVEPTYTTTGNIEYWEDKLFDKYYSDAERTQELNPAQLVTYKKLISNPIITNNGFTVKEDTIYDNTPFNWVAETTYGTDDIGDRSVEFLVSGKDVANARLIWWKDSPDYRYGRFTITIYVNGESVYSVNQNGGKSLSGVFVTPLPNLKTRDIIKFVVRKDRGVWSGSPTIATCLEYTSSNGGDRAPIHHEAVEPTYTNTGNIEYWEDELYGKYYLNAECTQEINPIQTIAYKKFISNPVVANDGFTIKEKVEYSGIPFNWAVETTYKSYTDAQGSVTAEAGTRYVEFNVYGKDVAQARLKWTKNYPKAVYGVCTITIYVNGVSVYSVNQDDDKSLGGLFIVPLPDLKYGDKVKFEVNKKDRDFNEIGSPTIAACLEYTSSNGGNEIETIHHEAVEPTYETVGNKEYWEIKNDGRFFSNLECTQEISPAQVFTYKKLISNPIAASNGFTFNENVTYSGVLFNWEAETVYGADDKGTRSVEFNVYGKDVANARLKWWKNQPYTSSGRFTITIYVNGESVYSVNQDDGQPLGGLFTVPLSDLKTGDKVKFEVAKPESASWYGYNSTIAACLEYTSSNGGGNDMLITAYQDPGHKANYYSTFYSSEYAYKVPEGVTAYTGVVDGSVLKLTAIADGIIPVGEPVILRLTTTTENNTATKQQFVLETTTTTATKSDTNALTGTDVAIAELGANDYALSLGQNGVGFYLWDGKSISAHKAYLTLDGAKAKAFIFQFENGETTGILKPVMDEKKDSPAYNLNGVRVNDNYKGIVIKNGKKIYNK